MSTKKQTPKKRDRREVKRVNSVPLTFSATQKTVDYIKSEALKDGRLPSNWLVWLVTKHQREQQNNGGK